ncbi:MAG: phage holin family protein [Methylotenera sp.]|nr:phage holin family protein [Methylotenera sp.]
MSNNNQHGGLLDTIASMAAGLVTMLHTRLALLSTDIEEEREHLLSLIRLSLISLFFIMLGLLLLAVLLIVVLWESYRLSAIAGLAGCFLTAGLVSWYLAKRKAKIKPRLFWSSLEELEKDRQALDQS